MRCHSKEAARRRVLVGTAVLVFGLTLSLAVTPQERRTSTRAEAAAPAGSERAGERAPGRTVDTVRPIMTTAVVTDSDPEAFFQSRTPVRSGSLNQGPFDAGKTLNLYIMGVYDRGMLGIRPFDHRVKLLLPNGTVYRDHVTVVDPAAKKGQVVQRRDLAPHAVPVASPARMLRVTRALPVGRLTTDQMRDAMFTTETIPVSGSWITQHGLYGTWTAVVSIERDGKVLSQSTTTFQLVQSR